MTILDEAREAKDVHRNVHLAIGRLAQSENEEETRIEQVSERVGKVRKWRVQHAEALLRATPPTEEVSGSYSGVPSPLELQVTNDGVVTGGFFPRLVPGKPAKLATITGRIDGAAIAFQWSEVIDPKEFMASYYQKAGHGVLLVTKNGLDGYWAEGSTELDSTNVDKRTDWHLTKHVPSPATPLLTSGHES